MYFELNNYAPDLENSRSCSEICNLSQRSSHVSFSISSEEKNLIFVVFAFFGG